MTPDDVRALIPTGVEALLRDAPSDVDAQCGAGCACHGSETMRCIRAPHAHERDDCSPHVARDGDGYVQWTCLESEANSGDEKDGSARRGA